MLNRRHVLGAALALAVVLSYVSLASAADSKPFDQAVFDASQAAGRPILVHVTAPWCPTCKAQAPILSRLESEPRFRWLGDLQYRFRHPKRFTEKIQCEHAEYLDRLQGPTRNRPFDRRHQSRLDRGAAGKGDLARMAVIGLAFLAGLLSTLSPCVLPLVPIVIGTALSENRYGPAALALGVALSYVAIGLFVATVGFAIGLDQDVFRSAAAILLILVGSILLLPQLQLQLAAAGPIGNWAQQRRSGVSTRGVGGQFAVGLMLGVVWSPCVGPTLGAASILAARAENFAGVALTMFAFGIGAALPLCAIGLVSREVLSRWRSRLLAAGSLGKLLMGVTLVAVGTLILTGLDKRVETVLVDASPAWLTELTTHF